MNLLLGFLKKTLHKIKSTLNKYTNFDETTFVSLKPNGKAMGSVLISYVAEPFFLKNGQSVPNTHTHYWESLEMAKIILQLGYNVDVISYRNRTFIPRKNYKLFIGGRSNFERIAKLLNGDCIKIAHMDMSHWLFNNASAISRCLKLQHRKGVTVKSYKLQEENWAVEHADYVSILGNDFTAGTYAYSGKPIFKLPIPSCISFPGPVSKDFESVKKNYLWFGSRGLVHKGLDIVIEAFQELPDHHLTICGPIKNDKDPKFEDLFYQELYETPNIHTVGWVDIESTEFLEIVENCVGMIFPSCAEGGGGCVVTTMHAGLIPIVSYQASVDVDESFGVMLDNSSVADIKDAVLNISEKTGEELKEMSVNAWKIARNCYTRNRYSEEFEKMIRTTLIDKVKNGRLENDVMKA